MLFIFSFYTKPLQQQQFIRLYAYRSRIWIGNFFRPFVYAERKNCMHSTSLYSCVIIFSQRVWKNCNSLIVIIYFEKIVIINCNNLFWLVYCLQQSYKLNIIAISKVLPFTLQIKKKKLFIYFENSTSKRIQTVQLNIAVIFI